MSNFLGKKISLISKALIRYEGVLYTIDQAAFTVALSKVKSFGTEERPAERFIAAREEVYEYIIFRGSDISDLHVCDSVYADDSAIVKIANMSPNATNRSSPPIVSSRNLDVNVDTNISNSIAQRQEPLSPAININKRFMDLSKAINRNDEDIFQNSQKQNNKYHAAYSSKFEPEDIEEIAAHDYRQFKNREQVNKSDLIYNHSANEENRQYNNYRRGTARRGVRGNYDGSNARGYMSTAARGRQTFLSNKDVLSLESIKDDFDFESSNALMAEELANMQIGYNDSSFTTKINRGLYSREDTFDDNNANSGVVDEDEKVFYDKSKSFFDNISCEVCDHSGNNMGDRRRRNNVETFGCSDYGRGNYRGSRWNGARGAFRGNYGGSSAGFIRRGGNSRRGDGKIDYRGQFTQRRSFVVNGGASAFDEDN